MKTINISKTYNKAFVNKEILTWILEDIEEKYGNKEIILDFEYIDFETNTKCKSILNFFKKNKKWKIKTMYFNTYAWFDIMLTSIGLEENLIKCSPYKPSDLNEITLSLEQKELYMKKQLIEIENSYIANDIKILRELIQTFVDFHTFEEITVLMNFEYDTTIQFEEMLRGRRMLEERFGIKINYKFANDILQSMYEKDTKLKYNNLMFLQDKYNILRGALEEDTVGILHTMSTKHAYRIEYQENEKSIVAILRKIEYLNDTRIKVYFDEFDSESFVPKNTNLSIKHTCYNLCEVGFNDLFLGTTYHFNLPIQVDKTKYPQMYIEENKDLNVPQYIKKVLDSNNIKYNESVLVECIKESIDRKKEK